MSRFYFPYGIRFRADRRIELFPAVEIVVFGKKGLNFLATLHLDSGATTSIFPAEDAAALGIALEEGGKTFVGGVTGEVLGGYQHVVVFQFGELKIKAPAIFVETQARIPRVLGREGIFEKFGIVFDESKRRTVFLKLPKERKIIDSLFQ